MPSCPGGPGTGTGTGTTVGGGVVAGLAGGLTMVVVLGGAVLGWHALRPNEINVAEAKAIVFMAFPFGE